MASANQRVGITGVGPLLAAIEAAPDEVRLELLVPVVRAGGKVVKEAARGLAPVQHGYLRDSIDQKEVRYPARDNAISVVGPVTSKRGPKGERPSKYAHLVEFGHATRAADLDRPDDFRPGERRRGLRKNGKQVVTFVPPQPFMRPALALGAGAAIQPMYEAAEKAFEQIGAKLESRYGHKRST